MGWQEEYERKLVTVEEAVGLVKSGDKVVFMPPHGGHPVALTEMLATRVGEVKDVEIHMLTPTTEYAFFEPGFEESFKLTFRFVSVLGRALTDEKRADFFPGLFSLVAKAESEGRPRTKKTDVFMVSVSPPDKHGYCSFGASVWGKKWYVESAKTVIAEVNKNQIRTYGDSLVHVSEIDYFVEHDSITPKYVVPETEEYLKVIGQYVGTLVKDRDTIALGAGALGGSLATQGVLDDKHDLGYHAENCLRGVVGLVREGVITGKHKNLHPGKVVCTNVDATGDQDDLAFINNNPMFEVYPQEYVLNIRTLAANDNMVAINSALLIDFTGQIASESIGHRMYTGSGGQPELAMGAMLSKGGRSITTVRSTTSDGKLSRIVPSLDPGTIVTVPRNFADYIVTEYGIASLLGKSQRERAQELIGIAHPDFRSELTEQARRLYWP